MIFRRWRMHKARRKLLEIGYVYDVMYEQPMPDRYLVHIWVTELNDETRSVIEPKIREVMKRRPKHIKVDVYLYRRDVA